MYKIQQDVEFSGCNKPNPVDPAHLLDAELNTSSWVHLLLSLHPDISCMKTTVGIYLGWYRN